MAENKTSLRDQIEPDDLPLIAEQICVEFDARKKRRGDAEKNWAEVDRQIAMIPELSHKTGPDGKPDARKKWMPEVELPLQAQTLEMLTTDCRRLKFPKGKDWFKCRAALTQDYIERFSKASNPIPGERGDNRSNLNQDNGDRLAQGVLSHFHNQYDFRSHIDKMDAEAIAYSFGVGRLRNVNKRILGHTAKGINMTIPVLVPRSAKHVYLDDSQSAIMHEGYIIGPNTLQWKSVKLADLQVAAKNDKSYIPEQVSRLKSDKNGEVQIIELEGDLIYETSQSTIVVRDVVLTAGKGVGDSTTFGMIREEKGEGFSTYVVFDYHMESSISRYGTSPLIKGMPIAKILAQTMNRLLESGQLKNAPPIGYSKDDLAFAGTGGPNIHPHALWPTVDDLNVYDEVGGDQAVLLATFQGLLALYYDVTGVNPPRLGAQTKSHTTAYAKDVELSQGASRTVDFVNSTLDGPLSRFLDLEYRMGRKNWKKQPVFIEAWNEFVILERDHLPDTVVFKAIGAGAPADDQAETQRKVSAIQIASQLDQASVQFGNQPRIDYGSLAEKVLQEAGFQDLTEVTVQSAGNGAAGVPQLPGLVSGEVPQ